MLAHELRNPLAPIVNAAHVLQTIAGEDPKAAAMIAMIRRQGQRLARLVDDLLDVSRIITGRLRLDLRPVDLASVIDAALDAVRPTAVAKGIAIECSIDPAATAVLARRSSACDG